MIIWIHKIPLTYLANCIHTSNVLWKLKTSFKFYTHSQIRFKMHCISHCIFGPTCSLSLSYLQTNSNIICIQEDLASINGYHTNSLVPIFKFIVSCYQLPPSRKQCSLSHLYRRINIPLLYETDVVCSIHFGIYSTIPQCMHIIPHTTLISH